MIFVGEHGLIIPRFDEAHFDQCPEIVRTDRRQFCPVAFDITQLCLSEIKLARTDDEVRREMA
jgi:hypothetical protein